MYEMSENGFVITAIFKYNIK